MRFVHIDDGIVTLVYRAKSALDKADQEVPEDSVVVEGDSRASYDEAWVLRPLSSRVAEGLTTIPLTKKLVGEVLQDKSEVELMTEGLLSIPEGYELEAGRLVQASEEALVRQGRLTSEEALIRKTARIQALRRTAYELELDPIRADVFRAELAGDTVKADSLKQKFLALDGSIRERYPL